MAADKQNARKEQNMEIELSPEEEKAIASFKRLAKQWPTSLWLFSANGTLNIMKRDENGDCAHLPHGGVDPDYSVAKIQICNSGGDW